MHKKNYIIENINLVISNKILNVLELFLCNIKDYINKINFIITNYNNDIYDIEYILSINSIIKNTIEIIINELIYNGYAIIDEETQSKIYFVKYVNHLLEIDNNNLDEFFSNNNCKIKFCELDFQNLFFFYHKNNLTTYIFKPISFDKKNLSNLMDIILFIDNFKNSIEKCILIYKNEININYKKIQNANELNQQILNEHHNLEEGEKEFKYYCKLCDFGTFSKYIYKNHIISEKHKKFEERQKK